VAALGKEVTREYAGRRLDIVITLDRGFVFAADLMRQIHATVVCHFVREEVRDVEQSGHARREVFFGSGPELKGRDVLLVDAVLESGVTQDFLLRRLGETSRARSGWQCCWISRRSGEWPWSPITLGSGPHLMICGLAMALRQPTGRGATSGSFLQGPMGCTGKADEGERSREAFILGFGLQD